MEPNKLKRKHLQRQFIPYLQKGQPRRASYLPRVVGAGFIGALLLRLVELFYHVSLKQRTRTHVIKPQWRHEVFFFFSVFLLDCYLLSVLFFPILFFLHFAKLISFFWNWENTIFVEFHSTARFLIFHAEPYSVVEPGWNKRLWYWLKGAYAPLFRTCDFTRSLFHKGKREKGGRTFPTSVFPRAGGGRLG